MISEPSITTTAVSLCRGRGSGKCSSVPEHGFTDPVSRDTRPRIALFCEYHAALHGTMIRAGIAGSGFHRIESVHLKSSEKRAKFIIAGKWDLVGELLRWRH